MPTQLSAYVPFDPTVFPSGPEIHLLYELYLTNFDSAPLLLRRVDVLDADSSRAQPVATFEGRSLGRKLQPVGVEQPTKMHTALDAEDAPYRLMPGGTVVVFMAISLPRNARVPLRLKHRIILNDASVDGAMIGTRHTPLRVLGAPIAGGNWLAASGPSNGQFNHHRRGIFVRDGVARISRRFATDWKQMRDGASFRGDPHDNHAYYAYGQPVLAVADGRIVVARDGLPDNSPGHGDDFRPGVPITIDHIGGNTITIELGDGQFAHYYHLQPNSLRVKAGDRVRRGQVIARIGASGDAREPHLHFEVSTAVDVLSGEGIPYVIDRYRVIAADDSLTAVRTGELPLEDMIIDFGQSSAPERASPPPAQFQDPNNRGAARWSSGSKSIEVGRVKISGTPSKRVVHRRQCCPSNAQARPRASQRQVARSHRVVSCVDSTGRSRTSPGGAEDAVRRRDNRRATVRPPAIRRGRESLSQRARGENPDRP